MTNQFDEEHERRFLVSDLTILSGSSREYIEQGYLWVSNGYAIRTRRTFAIPPVTGDNADREEQPAFFTLKGPRQAATRFEKEITIPSSVAADLIAQAPNRLEKTRHGVISESNAWVVDIFHGANEGLIIAEYEASKLLVKLLKRPWWCGPEVTDDRRYDNEQLSLHPWSTWPERHESDLR